LIVGVAPKNVDLYMNPADGLPYYGYICCAGKKISNKEGSVSYGNQCGKQDKVGVLLEFTGKEGRLSFYRNNVR
jgi:hypothetical protein